MASTNAKNTPSVEKIPNSVIGLIAAVISDAKPAIVVRALMNIGTNVSSIVIFTASIGPRL